jgi:hypothetical protein
VAKDRGPLAGVCEHGNKLFGAIKGVELLE